MKATRKNGTLLPWRRPIGFRRGETSLGACLKLSAFTAVALGCISCGGNGGASGSGSTGSQNASGQQYAKDGAALLNSALAPNGKRDSATLSAAATDFQNAMKAGINTPQVKVGYAVSEAASIGFQFLPGAPKAPSSQPSAFSASTSKIANALMLWNISKLKQNAPTVSDVAKPLVGLSTMSSVPFEYYQVYLEDALPFLRSVNSTLTDSLIQSLEKAPIVYPNPNGSGTLQFGSAEGYALRAAVRALQAIVDLALAYDFNLGTYDPNANFASLFWGKVQAGTAIPASSVLPPSPFGVLFSNGKTLMSDMGTQLNGALSDISNGVSTLQLRTAGGWYLDLVSYTPADLIALQVGTGLAKQFLAGPESIAVHGPQGMVTLSINIPAWISSPPSNLIQFAASIQGVPIGNGGYHIQRVPGSISDTTFGGLFPGGVPAGLLYYNEAAPNFFVAVGNIVPLGVAGELALGVQNDSGFIFGTLSNYYNTENYYGTYSGGYTIPSPAQSGSISFSVDQNGSISGKEVYSGTTYTLSGNVAASYDFNLGESVGAIRATLTKPNGTLATFIVTGEVYFDPVNGGMTGNISVAPNGSGTPFTETWSLLETSSPKSRPGAVH